MSEDLRSLVIQVGDEVGRILYLQQLLEICLDELSNPSEQAQSRVEVLVDTYLELAKSHFQKIQICLGWVLEELRNPGLGPP